MVNLGAYRIKVGEVATLSTTHRIIIGIQIILQNKKVRSTVKFVETMRMLRCYAPPKQGLEPPFLQRLRCYAPFG
jgi:hypothetical protein